MTMPRALQLEDHGLMLSAISSGAALHPPGYPAGVWVLWLLYKITSLLASPPMAASLASAAAAAVGAGLVVEVVMKRTRSTMAGLCAGALFAVSPAVWSQGTVCDVYTTLAAWLALAMLLSGERRPILTGVLGGVLLSTHWPLAVLCGGAVLAQARGLLGSPVNALKAGGAAAAVFIVAHAWLVWRTHATDVPFIYVGPIESWGDLVSYVRRDIYAGVDQMAGAGWRDKGLYLAATGVALIDAMTPWGLMLAGLGAWRRIRTGEVWRTTWEATAIGLPTVGLTLWLGFVFVDAGIVALQAYTVPAMVVLAVWTGDGIAWATRIRPERAWRRALAACGVILAGVSGWTGWATHQRSEVTFGEDLGRTILAATPVHATLALASSDHIQLVLALTEVMEERGDIELILAGRDGPVGAPGRRPLRLGDHVQRALEPREEWWVEWRKHWNGRVVMEGDPSELGAVNGYVMHGGILMELMPEPVDTEARCGAGREQPGWSVLAMKALGPEHHGMERVRQRIMQQALGELIGICERTTHMPRWLEEAKRESQGYRHVLAGRLRTVRRRAWSPGQAGERRALERAIEAAASAATAQ